MLKKRKKKRERGKKKNPQTLRTSNFVFDIAQIYSASSEFCLLCCIS